MIQSLLEIEISYTDDLQCRLPAQIVDKLSRVSTNVHVGRTAAEGGLVILCIQSEEDENRVAHAIYHGKVTTEYQFDKLIIPFKISKLFGFAEHERVIVRLDVRDQAGSSHSHSGSSGFAQGYPEADTVQLQVKSKFEWDLMSSAVVDRLETELLQLVNIVHLGQQLCYSLSPSIALTLTVSDIQIQSHQSQTQSQKQSRTLSSSSAAAEVSSGDGNVDSGGGGGWFGGGGVLSQLQSLYNINSSSSSRDGTVNNACNLVGCSQQPYFISPRTTLVVSPPHVSLLGSTDTGSGHPLPGLAGASDPSPSGNGLSAAVHVQTQEEIQAFTAISGCVSDVRLIDVITSAKAALSQCSFHVISRSPAVQLGSGQYGEIKETEVDIGTEMDTVPVVGAGAGAGEDIWDAALDMLELEFCGGVSAGVGVSGRCNNSNININHNSNINIKSNHNSNINIKSNKINGASIAVTSTSADANATASNGRSDIVQTAAYTAHPNSILLPLVTAFLSLSASSLRACGLSGAVGGPQARLCEHQWLRQHLNLTSFNSNATSDTEQVLRHFRWCTVTTKDVQEGGVTFAVSSPIAPMDASITESSAVCLLNFSRAVPYRCLLVNSADIPTPAALKVRLMFMSLKQEDSLKLPTPPTPALLVEMQQPRIYRCVTTTDTAEVSTAGGVEGTTVDNASTEYLHGLERELNSIRSSMHAFFDDSHGASGISGIGGADQLSNMRKMNTNGATAASSASAPVGVMLDSAVLVLGESGSGKTSILSVLQSQVGLGLGLGATDPADMNTPPGTLALSPSFVVVNCKELKTKPLSQILATLQDAFVPTEGSLQQHSQPQRQQRQRQRVVALDDIDELCWTPITTAMEDTDVGIMEGKDGSDGRNPGSLDPFRSHDEWMRANVISHFVEKLLRSNESNLECWLSLCQQYRYFFTDHRYYYKRLDSIDDSCGVSITAVHLTAEPVIATVNVGSDSGGRDCDCADADANSSDAERVDHLIRDRCESAKTKCHFVLLTASSVERLHPRLAGWIGGSGHSTQQAMPQCRLRHSVVQLPAVESHQPHILRRVFHNHMFDLRAVLCIHTNSVTTEIVEKAPTESVESECEEKGERSMMEVVTLSPEYPAEWLDHILVEISICHILELCTRALCFAFTDPMGVCTDAHGNIRLFEAHIRRSANDIMTSSLFKCKTLSKATVSKLSETMANVPPKFRQATFASIAGYAAALHQLTCVLIRPIRYAKLYALSPVKLPRNVLIYGPPGCGKSLLGHAIVNEMGCRCIVIHGPELLNKYTGASEKAVRQVFLRAQAAAPCVILFDEFEALGCKRGQDNTGVTDRVVNQLLTFIDGAEQTLSKSQSGNDGGSSGAQVYIIALSSRPDMIDPALLRPGRVEKHVFVGLPNYTDCLALLNSLLKPIIAAAAAAAAADSTVADSTVANMSVPMVEFSTEISPAVVPVDGSSTSNNTISVAAMPSVTVCTTAPIATTATADECDHVRQMDMGLYSWYATSEGDNADTGGEENGHVVRCNNVVTMDQIEEQVDERSSVPLTLDHFAPVCAEIAMAAVERRYTVADLEGVVKGVYTDAIYTSLSTTNSSQSTRPMFSPQQLRDAFYSSVGSLSARDMQFYDNIYAKFGGAASSRDIGMGANDSSSGGVGRGGDLGTYNMQTSFK